MSKHENLVNQIAEEMAYDMLSPAAIKRMREGSPGAKMYYNRMYGTSIPAARIAVKHMAEMYEAGYMVGRSKSDPLSYIGLKTMLTHLGLIPQTGEEAREK